VTPRRADKPSPQPGDAKQIVEKWLETDKVKLFTGVIFSNVSMSSSTPCRSWPVAALSAASVEKFVVLPGEAGELGVDAGAADTGGATEGGVEDFQRGGHGDLSHHVHRRWAIQMPPTSALRRRSVRFSMQ
jgi:hypothetical protein